MLEVGPAESVLGVALAVLVVAAAMSAAAVFAVAALSATTLAATPIVGRVRRWMWRDWHPPTCWLPDPKDTPVSAPQARKQHEPVLLCTDSPGVGSVQLLAAEGIPARERSQSGDPMATVLHARLNAGADLELPGRAGAHLLIYVLAGRGSVGAERLPVCPGQLVVTNGARSVPLHADRKPVNTGLDVLVLGELPARQPLPWPGPSVVSGGTEIPRRLHRLQEMMSVPPPCTQPETTMRRLGRRRRRSRTTSVRPSTAAGRRAAAGT